MPHIIDNLPLIRRTNLRTGENILLQTLADGTPKCPHCTRAMGRIEDKFENYNCPCWWTGADRADYALQVSIYADEAGEEAYQHRRAFQLREEAAQDFALASKVEARRLSMVGRKATTRITFANRGHGTAPYKGPEHIEVEILRCYVKNFSVFEGGSTEVVDVKYPDGRVFYLRMKQINLI